VRQRAPTFGTQSANLFEILVPHASHKIENGEYFSPFLPHQKFLQQNPFLSGFFENVVLVWFAGAFLLFSGLLIIAFHQYWSSLAGILISLFGWFLALRGLVLLAAPQLIARGGTAAMDMIPIVRIGFGDRIKVNFGRYVL
jgi:hypothetical protein